MRKKPVLNEGFAYKSTLYVCELSLLVGRKVYVCMCVCVCVGLMFVYKFSANQQKHKRSTT